MEQPAKKPRRFTEEKSVEQVEQDKNKRPASPEEETLLAYVVLADKKLRWAWLVLTATFKFTFHILSCPDPTSEDKKLANKVQEPMTDFASRTGELFCGKKKVDKGFHRNMMQLEYEIDHHQRHPQEIVEEGERHRDYDINFARSTTDLEQTQLELLHQADVAMEEVFKVMCRAYEYSKSIDKAALRAQYSDLLENSCIFFMNEYLRNKATALQNLYKDLHKLYKDTKCDQFRQPSLDIQGVAVNWIVSFDK